MTKSDDIKELAVALAKAQGRIKGASKDSVNPHFKAKYADLASVWDACRAPLSENGLSVVQTVAHGDGKIALETMLLHASGQWVGGSYPVTPKAHDPQSVGAAVTYARRFSLMAMVGIAPEDDDGESQMNRPRISTTPPHHSDFAPPPPLPFEEGGYRIPFGKFNGKRLDEIPAKELLSYCDYIEDESKSKNKPIKGDVAEFMDRVKRRMQGEE
jgi:hypothetical protein